MEDNVQQILKNTFSKNLRYYMDLNNKTAIDVCRDLKIKQSTYSDWMNAKIYPRIDKIQMLADYFNIRKSDLIEEMDSK